MMNEVKTQQENRGGRGGRGSTDAKWRRSGPMGKAAPCTRPGAVSPLIGAQVQHRNTKQNPDLRWCARQPTFLSLMSGAGVLVAVRKLLPVMADCPSCLKRFKNLRGVRIHMGTCRAFLQGMQGERDGARARDDSKHSDDEYTKQLEGRVAFLEAHLKTIRFCYDAVLSLLRLQAPE